MRRGKSTIVAVACGALCAVCVALYLQEAGSQAEEARAEALARYGGEQVEVCVAKRDIAPGEAVDTSAVESKLWVADLLPEGALQDADAVVGQRATSAILKGEALSQRRFEGGESVLEVPDDLIAVSVPARAVQAVGGALAPGMDVDVYATGSSGTEIIARSVQVLATSTSSSYQAAGEQVTWITLAVAPRSVQEMVATAQTSEFYFTLP